jgi:cytochrome c oxidase accessory protein FixG
VKIALSEEQDTFRNELASVSRDGRRKWVYARQPSGWLYRARTILSWFLLGFLFAAPFVTIGGQPLMMLNVLERKFVLGGMLFRPQDFYLVVLIALTALVTLVLATVVIGRVWCGWLCPHTVFMEMLFRKLEYLIEGSVEQQLRRDRGPWTREKVLRKGIKHGVFFVLSFVIANVFLAWIIGAGQLRDIVTDSPTEHLVGLLSILVFSFVFYMVFARFREQACVLACPYGRMMSALTDARTVTVTYDWKRGEPRSRLIRGGTTTGASGAGDCIDCHQCVTVCPTGIDIRHGIQLECVNCTACIDACDAVMARVRRPTGLIRFTSEQAIREGHTRWLTVRSAGYVAVWMMLVGSLTVAFAGRRDLDVVILRQPGTLYTTLAGGDVANFYNVQVLNRTGQLETFTIEAVEPRGATVTPLGQLGQIEPYGAAEGRLLLRVPSGSLVGASTSVRFAVRTRDGVVQTIDSAFVGPATR